MRTWKIEDDRLSAILTEENDSLWLTVRDLAGGKEWPKTPLMNVYVHDKAVQRETPMKNYRIDLVEEAMGGLHVIVGDRATGVDVGLWLKIVDGELSVSLAPAEVYERNNRLYRVYAIDILPGMMQAGPSEAMLLPINTGVVCNPARKPPITDKFLIYGEQSRWELMPTLPFCGVHGAEGGMMCLAISGADDTECRVSTDGKGSGDVGFAFSLRRLWPDPVDIIVREFRYTPVPPRADPTLFVAKRLRRHIMQYLGKKTLTERAAESPELAYTLQAYTMKLFHGVENVGYMMEGSEKSDPISFFNCMTFPEAEVCLQRLHDAGIDKLYTMSVGWNSRGHDGMYPTRFPIDKRLGGEDAFRHMIEFGNSLGYAMNVHDNFVAAGEHSPDRDAEYLVEDIFGEPLIHGYWSGGIDWLQWPPAFPEERLAGHMRKMKSLGLKGLYYMDGMGNLLEVNYHPRHKGGRRACAEGVALLVEKAREIYGSSATETGWLYCTIPADYIAARPGAYHLAHCDPAWPVTNLMDRIVPIWQLALHDLVINENNQGPYWKSAINSVLFGDHPRDEWSVRPQVMPVLDDERIHAEKAMYDLVLGRFGYLQTTEIVGYSEPSDGVKQTKFADGTTVAVDAEREQLFVNDKIVERPQGLL